MASNNQIIISRIQNRRGLKENLPQPLLPGEIALTVDTGELWVGSDPDQPPYGVRTYSAGAGDISTAETIVDTKIASVKFTTDLSSAEFEGLADYLTDAGSLLLAGAPALILTEDDIFWDGLATVFIAADSVTVPANTINNILDAILLEPTLGESGSNIFDSARSGALGAYNEPFVAIPSGDFPLTLTFADANPDTIVRNDSQSWVTDGFFVGQKIVVTGTGNNDGTYTIDSFATTSGADDTIVLDIADELDPEGPVSADQAMVLGRSDPTVVTPAFDPTDGDFQLGDTDELGEAIRGNSVQAANIANLVNNINGAGLVTTFGNLQISTSGIGVGTPTFRDMTVTDTDAGYGWAETGTASADSTTDELTFVSGTNVNIDVDTVNDAIRISSTANADPDTVYSGFTTTPPSGNVATEATLTAGAVDANLTNVVFDIDGESDVIFVEYSLNIGANLAGNNNLTAIGNMRIVASNTTDAPQATIVDDRTTLIDSGYAGNIDFQAAYVAGTPVTTATSLDFNDNGASPDTIVYDTGPGNFLTDGFVNGQKITVTGSVNGNNGTYTISLVGATTITLVASDTLVSEAGSSASISGRNQVRLQYTNSYGDDALFRSVYRRWMSYDYENEPPPPQSSLLLISNVEPIETVPYLLYSTDITNPGSYFETDFDVVGGSGTEAAGLLAAWAKDEEQWIVWTGRTGVTGLTPFYTTDSDITALTEFTEVTPAIDTNNSTNRHAIEYANGVAVVVGHTNQLAPPFGAGIQYSTDGGLTWNEKTPALTNSVLYDVRYRKNNEWWTVGGNGEIYTSVDNAVTWTDGISGPINNLFTIEFVDAVVPGDRERIVVYNAFGQFYWSDNNGGSWTQANPTGLPANDVLGAEFNSSWIRVNPNSGTLVACGNGSTNKVAYSTDNGENWNLIAAPFTANFLPLRLWYDDNPVSPGGFILVGTAAPGPEVEVWRSDDGITWTRIFREFTADVSNTWGATSKDYYTHDMGKNFGVP